MAEGGDLNELLKQYNLNEQLVKLFIAEMVIALDYLHSKKIYHKDLKPANIVITKKVLILFLLLGSF